jgi:NhaP-type Na+/H+ or K+/H+ antiporter
MVLITAFIVLVFLYSLVSKRLERTVVTAPILFTVAGAFTMLLPPALSELAIDRPTFLLIAELGLVMTLFTDASRINLVSLRGSRGLRIRLLSTGMLLTILLGAMAAMVLFGGLSWQEAGILGAILAPTDAGLGQVIVNSQRVPPRIREALNFEAGLNDGLSVPFLMCFIALAMVENQGTGAASVLARFLGEQLGYGTLIGLGAGLAGGALLGLARRKEWMAPPLTQLGVVAIPLLCVMASEATHASMFIAAFVAGLVTQIGFRHVGRHSVEFTEDWGQLLNFFVFFLFGLFVARSWTAFTLPMLLYALASLTVVRMLPVALALRGTGLSRSSVLFIGWFGPRGLASIVLGLVYLEQQVSLPGEDTIRLTIMLTVLLSILVHGLSALPGIKLYARRVAALDAQAPELRGVADALPGREGDAVDVPRTA